MDLQVGDLVKKVRGASLPGCAPMGYQGWVKAVYVIPVGRCPITGIMNQNSVGIYVTGLPDKGVLPGTGRPFNGYRAENWEKVTPTGVDKVRKVLLLTDQRDQDKGVA